MSRTDELRIETKDLLSRVFESTLFSDISELDAKEIDINLTLKYRPRQPVTLLASKNVQYTSINIPK